MYKCVQYGEAFSSFKSDRHLHASVLDLHVFGQVRARVSEEAVGDMNLAAGLVAAALADQNLCVHGTGLL